MAPRSQKASERPIAFRLEDGAGADTTVGLVIRPEDLSRNEMALQAPVQTLNGAFLDDFGPGLSTIQISGHTGWGAGSRPDGHAAFQNLHATVWTQWHAARKAAVAAGRSPTTVRLTFLDDLDEICVVVAPGAFALKRSRARPLLAMYSINMTVLNDQITAPLKDPLNFGADGSAASVKKGLSSLKGSIDTLKAKADQIHTFVDSNLVQPLHSVITQANTAMSKVMSVVGEARGIVNGEAAQFVGIARDLSLVGRNVFNTYNAVANLPDFAAHEVSAVAGAFSNAFCVLGNAFKRVHEYPDFDSIYGASNCSSTVGGSPISPLLAVNPWEIILPAAPSVAAITPAARNDINRLMAADPVLAPMGASELGSRVQAAMSGVTFPWL